MLSGCRIHFFSRGSDEVLAAMYADSFLHRTLRGDTPTVGSSLGSLFADKPARNFSAKESSLLIDISRIRKSRSLIRQSAVGLRRAQENATKRPIRLDLFTLC